LRIDDAALQKFTKKNIKFFTNSPKKGQQNLSLPSPF